MRFKLIIAFVEDSKTKAIMEAAREAGATGCTVLTNARGQGVEEKTTFLGLALESQRDMVLMLVEEHRARGILEQIATAGKFDMTPGTGIAFQVDVEDAVGVLHQAELIAPSLEEAEL
ncbi:MAG: P-II family nitrogen regulator [Chromatiales bacterium]|nr:P-II family nitrogen regulator [Chromatiales bacterium]